MEQTRIDAIIVAHRYSAINRAILAISFLAGLRPHLICAQPSSLTPFLAAQRRHVNLSKYTTNGSKLRNPIKEVYVPDLRSGRLSPSVACRTYASTFDTILFNFDTILKSCQSGGPLSHYYKIIY